MNHWARKNTGITNTKGQMIPLFLLTWLDGGQRGWSAGYVGMWLELLRKL